MPPEVVGPPDWSVLAGWGLVAGVALAALSIFLVLDRRRRIRARDVEDATR